MTMLVKDSRLFSNVRMPYGKRFVLSVSDGDRPADLCVTDASFSTIKPNFTNLNPWLGEPARCRSRSS